MNNGSDNTKGRSSKRTLLRVLLLIMMVVVIFGGGVIVGRLYQKQQETATSDASPTAVPTDGPVSPTGAPTSAPVLTPTITSAPTITATVTPAHNLTPINTPTAVPTSTPAPTPTITSAPTNTPPATSTPVPTPTASIADTADSLRVSARGQLQVIGTQLCDANGTPITLRGISTAGIAWFPQLATKEYMQTLRDEWNISVFRIAMYSYEGNDSYVNNPAWNKKKVCELIDAAIDLDLYVIADWHILADGNPQTYQTQAIEFFTYISERYAGVPNILYEICNEPNGNISWSGNVKPYAEAVIPVIRASSPDAVIIVGSPTWSQDVDQAAQNPLTFDNLMYSLHFYANTHKEWLRDKATIAMNKGLAIFATEWGTTDASGTGYVNTASSDEWLAFFEQHGISWCNWSLCNKAESSALLLPSAVIDGTLPDSALSESGKYIKKKLLEYGEKFPAKDTTIKPTPAPDITAKPTPTPDTDPKPTPDVNHSTVASPTPVLGSNNALLVLSYNEDRSATTNSISPRIQLQNHSAQDISLATIELRYYYTPEADIAQKLWCDYADINGSHYLAVTELITGSFETGKNAKSSCMVLRFSSGTLPAGDTLTMQLRITNEDWSNYDQSNDRSFFADAISYTENPKITVSVR